MKQVLLYGGPLAGTVVPAEGTKFRYEIPVIFSSDNKVIYTHIYEFEMADDGNIQGIHSEIRWRKW